MQKWEFSPPTLTHNWSERVSVWVKLLAVPVPAPGEPQSYFLKVPQLCQKQKLQVRYISQVTQPSDVSLTGYETDGLYHPYVMEYFSAVVERLYSRSSRVKRTTELQ